MSNSYQKLKQKNSALKAEIAALKSELSTVVLSPDSHEAAEIKAKVIWEKDVLSIIDCMPFIGDGKPPYTTEGIIPHLQPSTKLT